MIRKLFLNSRLLWVRFNAHEQRMTARMNQLAKVETFGAMLLMVAMLAGLWAFAWYAHIIGPWVDAVMGWGPHDIDSAGKIRWRRIWSTAICLPGIVAFVGLYILNVRDRRRGGASSSSTSSRFLDKAAPDVEEVATRTSTEAPLPAAVTEARNGSPRLQEAPQQPVPLLIKSPSEQPQEFGNARLEIKDGQATLTIKGKPET